MTRLEKPVLSTPKKHRPLYDWCVDGVGAVLHAVDATSRPHYLLSAATRRPERAAAG